MKTTEERFFAKVDGGDHETCWEWTGARNNDGYGEFRDRRKYKAHRWSWEFFNGPIPEGLVTDHLCLNRSCVNPWHLEMVSRTINSQRRNGWTNGTCRNGHALTPENCPISYENGRPRSYCRTCRNAWQRATDTRRRPRKRVSS